MTRKECAEVLQAIKFLLDSGNYSERVEEALDMAISIVETESESIVRCKDCKFWREQDMSVYGQCEEYSDQYGFPMEMRGDDYCSGGERKEE